MTIKSVTPMSRHNVLSSGVKTFQPILQDFSTLESGGVSVCSLVYPGVAGRLPYRRRW